MNDKSFIQWFTDDNCKGDKGSAVIYTGILAMLSAISSGSFLLALLSGSFVAIAVIGLVFLWCSLEVYHLGRGYIAHVTGDKSYKFHWSIRWRAHMYRAYASKAYFNEYNEWIREN